MVFTCRSILQRTLCITKPVFFKENWKVDQVRSLCSEKEKALRSSSSLPSETIFDKILQGKIPADVIHEDDMCIAFKDVMPQAPMHFLVIPRKKIPTLADSSEQDQALLGHLMLVARKLGRERAPRGFRLVVNNGPEGCQSVYHLHVHVLGGRQMDWPPG